MALTDKLRDLDQRLLPGTREQDEDAETYLRRVASSRAISPAQAGDVMAALRVYFDVAPGGGDDAAEEGSEEEGADESKDEADGEKSDEKSEEKDESEDKEEEKEDDES